MMLSYLNINGFRNLSTELEPIQQGFNCFYGNNGSGKTSLLEAIYYLSIARSFRSPLTARIIHYEAPKLTIFARLFEVQSQQVVPVGLERYADGGLKLRLHGNDIASIVELAGLLPMQLIDSHCHRLLEGVPAIRRKFLDWGVFYSNQNFLTHWRRFMRALKQRNAALRHGNLNELIAWDHNLYENALKIDQARREYVAELAPMIELTLAELLLVPGLKISYEAGFAWPQDYREILHLNTARDRQLGFTQFGPHKADLKITINKIPAKDILSRGQQKLFVCAMILARGALLQNQVDKRPVYLIDDLPSELDEKNRSSLIALLSRQETQIFMTTTDSENWNNKMIIASPIKMFHVEHGRVSDKGVQPTDVSLA